MPQRPTLDRARSIEDTAAAMQRLHLRIRGRVQGVYYRANTRRQATQLGLTGWVRNRDDGSVELVAEGPRADLERLLSWCQEGPPAASVTACEPSWVEASGEFDTFSIVY
jgi:acylphosphatase